MKKITVYIFMFCLCFYTNKSQAQHILNGSFEDNNMRWTNYPFSSTALSIFGIKNVEYLIIDTIMYNNNKERIYGYGELYRDTFGWFDDTINFPPNGLNIKIAPHGKNYLAISKPFQANIFVTKYHQLVIFMLSDSLTIGKRYAVRYYAGNEDLKANISNEYLVTGAGTTNRKVGLVIDSLRNKDEVSGYREYVTSFVADSNYKYIYLYLINTNYQNTRRVIDHIRLDSCVQLANTQFIGCAQIPALLTPISISADNKYYWSTGDTTHTIYAQKEGSYKAYTYAKNGCTQIDSFVVLLKPALGVITTSNFCQGNNLTLQAAAVANTYKWNTGDTTQNINITQQGKYWVTRGIVGCQVTDSFYITQVTMPSAQIIDTFYCSNSQIQIGITDAQKYTWNTTDTLPQIQVNKAGKYWVIKTNTSCQNTDTFNIIEKDTSLIKLAKDTTVCFDHVAQILLDAGLFKSYVWKPTNETTQKIYSKAPQTYFLQVTDSNNCVMSKQITVINDCPEKVFIPNAFTPNGDGLNDVFVISTNNVLENFEMQIYNRWGVMIFNTNNYQQGWDGKNAPSEVYVVKIKYQQKNKPLQNIIENVTLLN